MSYLKRVDENQYKLDHLHGREISFPPEIFLDAGTAGGEEVVEVHDRVDTAVEERTKATVTATDKFGPEPTEPGQDAVVDDVEGGEMVELLANDKEEAVEKVDKLGEVVNVGHIESPESRRT